MNDNELKHYGVLGMRWGKRKARYGNPDGDNNDSQQEEIERKRSRNKKIAIAAVGTLAAVSIGAVIYAKHKNKRSSKSVELSKVFESGKQLTGKAVKQIANKPLNVGDGWEFYQ